MLIPTKYYLDIYYIFVLAVNLPYYETISFASRWCPYSFYGVLYLEVSGLIIFRTTSLLT